MSVFAQEARPPQNQTVVFDGLEVDVKSVLKFNDRHGQFVYRIEAAYRSKQPFVLNGVPGTVGEGVFVMLSKKPELALADPTGRSIRDKVALTRIDLPAGPPVLDIPDLGDFPPPQIYSFASKDNSVNEQKVVNALGQYFPPGNLPLTFTRPFRLVSLFRTLDTVRSPYRGKVAVMVEFPVDSTNGKADSFRLSWVVFESRIGSSGWIKAKTKDIIRAAEEYVKSFRTDISP
jgi:hypothetical protein